MNQQPSSWSDYPTFLAELKTRILNARIHAARSVNLAFVCLYWDIGRGIVEKQRAAGWGDAVVERLAADLRAEFPHMRGFSANNLWLARQMYLEYTMPDFLEQAVQEIRKHRPGILEQPVQELRSVAVKLLEQTVPERALGKLVEGGIPAQIVRELIAPVPWGHHVEILKKIKNPAARLYYLQAVAR